MAAEIVPIVRRGYRFSHPILITFGRVPENLTGKIVRVSLKNYAKDTELIADVEQSSSTTGANWTLGRVIVEFTPAQTLALPDSALGRGYLEICVEDGGEPFAMADVLVNIEEGFALG